MKKFIALSIVLSAALGIAQDEVAPEKSAAPSRAQLKEKQADAVLESQSIEAVLSKLKRASDLAKQRIVEATKTTDEASQAIDRGNSKQAKEDAAKAAEMFREIAKQLEALLKEETPQRIQAAQQIAAQLAEAERQFLKQFAGAMNASAGSGQSKVDPKTIKQPRGTPGQGKGGQKDQNQTPGKNGENDQNEGDKPNANGSKPETPQTGEGSAGKDDQQPMGSGAGNEKKQDEPGAKKSDELKAGGGQRDHQDKADNGSGGSKDEQKDEAGAGSMTAEQARELLAKRAEQLARTGQTLEDVLKSITESTNPADNEAIARIKDVLKETNLSAAVKSMQAAADQIRKGKLDDARLASLDVADRMEITSQRLGATYRAIVAPQAEDLIKVEQQLAALRDRMDDLETPSDVRTVMRELADLLSKLEDIGMSSEARDELLQELRKAGWGTPEFQRTVRDWLGGGSRYDLPGSFAASTHRLQIELQERIQTLIVGDISAATDEVAPPKYEELVERYLQVLSRDSARAVKSEARKPKAETNATPRVDKPLIRKGQS